MMQPPSIKKTNQYYVERKIISSVRLNRVGTVNYHTMMRALCGGGGGGGGGAP